VPVRKYFPVIGFGYSQVQLLYLCRWRGSRAQDYILYRGSDVQILATSPREIFYHSSSWHYTGQTHLLRIKNNNAPTSWQHGAKCIMKYWSVTLWWPLGSGFAVNCRVYPQERGGHFAESCWRSVSGFRDVCQVIVANTKTSVLNVPLTMKNLNINNSLAFKLLMKRPQVFFVIVACVVVKGQICSHYTNALIPTSEPLLHFCLLYLPASPSPAMGQHEAAHQRVVVPTFSSSCSLPQRPDRFWGLPSLLFSGHCDSLRVAKTTATWS
jgi:hypothetical protein